MYKYILLPTDGSAHGKGGASAVLLGSETVKVLTHSPIPWSTPDARKRGRPRPSS